MHRLHGVHTSLPRRSDLCRRRLAGEVEEFRDENKNGCAGAANITAKKEGLGKDKPECSQEKPA